MRSISTSRYLGCLIGLTCRTEHHGREYLIIDISPTHSVVLQRNGEISYASPGMIRLTTGSQLRLEERLNDG